jgi:hypothetical protein
MPTTPGGSRQSGADGPAAAGVSDPTMRMRRFHRRRFRVAWRPPGDRLLVRFRLPLLLLVAVTLYGVIGYRVLEGWSLLDALYMTVTTLTTVGFREVHPLGVAGRAFTMSLILAGVMALFVALGVVTELVVSGQLARVLRRRRMDSRIARLDRHTVICAYGRVGRAVAEELARQDLPFVVIERQEALIPALEEHGLPYIAADPTAEEVLRRAGIQRARALVCAVDSDAANVQQHRPHPGLLAVALDHVVGRQVSLQGALHLEQAREIGAEALAPGSGVTRDPRAGAGGGGGA